VSVSVSVAVAAAVAVAVSVSVSVAGNRTGHRLQIRLGPLTRDLFVWVTPCVAHESRPRWLSRLLRCEGA